MPVEKLLPGLLEVYTISSGIFIEDGDYQIVQTYLYDEVALQLILDKMKFKSVGSTEDYPGAFDEEYNAIIDAYDISTNFDLFKQLAYSKKYKTLMYYSVERYSIRIIFIVKADKLEKFSRTLGPILRQDNRSNIFQNVTFTDKAGEFHEISDADSNDMKDTNATIQTVEEEKLVFHESSTIYNVLNDIMDFFSDKTKKIYKKMDIAYKRGIILYGNPGNGKSAMIREIIRRSDDVIKVVINPNTRRVTRVLSSLITALNGKKAIIIIEDIDSLINDTNRSDFLNILDGVSGRSGMYFIGTTNYPEKIDPAFMNRSGRFDRTFEIEDPTEETRREFFKSRKIGKLLADYKTFKDDSKPDSDDGVVELFVKFSEGLPMASLKELMTSTRYALAVDKKDMSIEEALEEVHSVLVGDREKHVQDHDEFKTSVSEFNIAGMGGNAKRPRRRPGVRRG